MPELHALLRLDDRPGPAPPIADAAAMAMIDRAVDAAFGPGPVGGGGGAGSAGGGALKLWVGAAVIAAAAVAAWLVLRPPQRGVAATTPAVAIVDAAPPPVEGEPPERAVVNTAPEPELELDADVAPRDPPPAEKKPERPPDKKVEAPKESAEDLLGAANAARRKRAWKDAAALYERVV